MNEAMNSSSEAPSQSKKTDKLVLAYNGGLDISYCVVSLSKAGYEVHDVSVNTSGFTKKEIIQIN